LAASLNVSHRIKFCGLLSKKEWIELAKDKTIFLSTTDWDNAPVSLIEAAALGMPVVSTNVGGIPYMFKDEHDILLASAGDADGFCRHIKRLMSDKNLYKSIAANARIKAEQHDWETACLPLWKQMLEPYVN
jgi:glycosyltransferase involved in cell wall biosynthesis